MDGTVGFIVLLAVLCLLSGPVALIVSLVALARFDRLEREAAAETPVTHAAEAPTPAPQTVKALCSVGLGAAHLLLGGVVVVRCREDSDLWRALMVIGFWRRVRPLRYLALGIFVLLLGKIFLVDTRELETIYRIAGFLATGLALVGVSYLYQYLKKTGFFDAMLAEENNRGM